MNDIGTIRIKEEIMKKKKKKMVVLIQKPLRVLPQKLIKVSSQSDEWNRNSYK
jgi:hypothetical protein